MENSLPRGWAEVDLKDVVYFQEGPGLRKYQFGDKGIPFLNIRTFNDDETLDKSKCRFVLESEFKNKYEHFLLNEGDIVVSSSGTLGKLIIIRKQDLPVMLNTSVIRFRSLDERVLLQAFLKYVLKSDIFHSQIQSSKTGMAIDNYGPSHLEKMKLLLPPVAEQHRIVEKLDALLTRVGSCKTRLKRMTYLEETTFLAFIFEGGEMFKGRLLEKFCQEGTERIGADWKKRRLIGVSKDAGIVDLRTGGKLTFENYKIVKPGDFIYNPMRVDIGSIAIYDGVEDAITSPDYVVFRVDKSVSPRLLLKFLKSSYGLAEINNNTQGSVRSRLYFRNLINIKLPYSDLEKQREAEMMFQFFNKYNVRQQKLTEYIDKMVRSILAKAFRGELVEQDENDESASELLTHVKSAEKKEKQIKNKTSLNPKNTVYKMKSKNHAELQQILNERFKKRGFIFSDVEDLFSRVEYNDRRDELFKLVKRAELEMSFDNKKNQILFKLK